MSTNLLDRVCDYLLRKGEEFELVLSPDNPSEKIGVAYVQYDLDVPASFLYTEETSPQTLILDVLFAARIPEDRFVEMSVILGKLNEDQKSGNFRLDTESGYVYYRQSCVIDGLGLSDEQFKRLLDNMEKIGIETTREYAEELEAEFPNR